MKQLRYTNPHAILARWAEKCYWGCPISSLGRTGGLVGRKPAGPEPKYVCETVFIIQEVSLS